GLRLRHAPARALPAGAGAHRFAEDRHPSAAARGPPGRAPGSCLDRRRSRRHARPARPRRRRADDRPPRPPRGRAARTRPVEGTAMKKVVSWSLWDWGSASFNAVILTFVFSVYLVDGVG